MLITALVIILYLDIEMANYDGDFDIIDKLLEIAHKRILNVCKEENASGDSELGKVAMNINIARMYLDLVMDPDE